MLSNNSSVFYGNYSNILSIGTYIIIYKTLLAHFFGIDLINYQPKEGQRFFCRDPKLTIGERFFPYLAQLYSQLLLLVLTVTLTDFLKWRRRLNGDGEGFKHSEIVLTLATGEY